MSNISCQIRYIQFLSLQQYQSMEEIHDNIFVNTTLPEKFNQQLWNMIQQQTAPQFQTKQQLVYQLLLKDPSLQQQFLSVFKQNHLRLYHWYLLASREQQQIEPYLFTALIRRNQFRQTCTPKVQSTFPHRTAKTQPNKIKKLFHNPHKYNLILSQKIDSHQLYLQTFSACQGQRYTTYNYPRYLKKADFEKGQYNRYIRQGRHASNHLKPIYSSNKSLFKYEQCSEIKQSSPLLCFRSVITNNKLNNESGLQSLLHRKPAKKIVFVNHQRKPVNYYLRIQTNNN